MRRWARGRLPRTARDLADTDDLVQTTLIRTLEHLDRLRLDNAGSFLAYLRQVLLNAARREMRRSARGGGYRSGESLEAIDAAAPPEGTRGELSRAVLIDYERALESLPETQRQAVILRIEFGLSYPEIAIELESPSANAARMMVSRSLARLAQDLGGSEAPAEAGR